MIRGPVGGTAPQKLTDPSFSGTLQEGETLTATDATFSGTPAPTVSRVWQRCSSASAGSCSDIPGTQGDNQYTLTSADVGFRIRYVNTASNGVPPAAVAPTNISTNAVTGIPPTAPQAAGKPTITPIGTPVHFQTLTAHDTTFTGTQPITVTRQWQRCTDVTNPLTCSNISGATGPTYTLQQLDVDRGIRVVNIATNSAAPGGVTAASDITDPVDPAPPTSTSLPTITPGTPDTPRSVGQTVGSTPGTFNGTAPISAPSRQWERCTSEAAADCVGIDGATQTNYTFTADDVGKRVRVVVTVSNPGGVGTHASATSAVVGGVAPTMATPSTFTPMTNLVVGQTLTGTDATFDGTPDPDASRTRFWERCDTSPPPTVCNPISGTLHSNQYTLTTDDVGFQIRFVTAANNGVGPTVLVPSSLSDPVAAPAITPPAPIAPDPSISGTLVEGKVVQGVHGGWTGSPTSYEYRFQRCTSTDPATCVDVTGVLGEPARYTLTSADVGKRLRVLVRARNGGGLSPQTAESFPTEPVTANRPPVARFTASNEAPLIGDTIRLTSTSSDPEGDPLTYAWDLDGDGQHDDDNRREVTISYSTPGPRNVSLRVTSRGQLSAPAFITIAVRDLPPDPPPRAISPFPRITIHGRAFRSGTRVTVFRITAPRGASIDARCSRSRNCPFRRVRGRITARNTRVRAFQRTFRPGARIEIRLTQRGRIGKWVRVQFRRRRAPLMTHRCLFPGSTRVRRCPRGVR